MNLPSLILRGMLAVATPGVTVASRVALPAECDEGCRAVINDLTGVAPTRDYRWLRATWPGWSRQETEMEAFERWTGIAEGIASVVASPPPSWTWAPAELRVLLVTVARHESAFWRSVQEGRLRGPAGEWGLWQCHPTLPGCNDTLVGLEPAAVERAARFAAEALGRARRWADADCSDAAWLPATFVIYGTGVGCSGTLPSLEARLGTYGKVEQASAQLPFGALYALGHFQRTNDVAEIEDARIAEVF